jgi:hypothetical protein
MSAKLSYFRPPADKADDAKPDRTRDDVAAPPRQSTEERPPPAPPAQHFNANRPFKPGTIEQAMQLQAGAEMQRVVGKEFLREGNFADGQFALAQADTMEGLVTDFLDIGTHVTGPQQVGNGGELIVRTSEAMGTIPGVVDTVRESPDMLSAGASRQRLELTGNALSMAVDAAKSIGARNSPEKMLAHEMAAAHRLAMLFAQQSERLIDRHETWGPINPVRSIEAARLANASAKMMTAFQEGLLVLERIRRGGRQTVRVVHVHQQVAVGKGGNAVVAGNVKSGGGRKAGGRRSNNAQ